MQNIYSTNASLEPSISQNNNNQNIIQPSYSPIQKYSFEQMQEICKKLDLKAQDWKNKRKPRETEWADVIEAASSGKMLKGRSLELSKQLSTNLADTNFPLFFQQGIAEKVGFLGRKWHELEPVGDYYTDLFLSSFANEFISQKLNNELSGWANAYQNIIAQLELINFAPFLMGWNRIAEPNYNFKVNTGLDGYQQIQNISENPNVLNYQGLVIWALNAFRVFLDPYASSFQNINNLNMFFFDGYSVLDILRNSAFNSELFYAYQDFTYYRSVQGMNDLMKSQFIKPLQEQELDSSKTPSTETSHTEGLEVGNVELYTWYLKDLRLGENDYMQNVKVCYARGNQASSNNIVPLLFEQNCHPFVKKPVRIVKLWDNQHNLYNPSKFEIVYNTFVYMNWLKAGQANLVARTAYPTEFVPQQLENATGMNPAKFKENYNTLGRRFRYNFDSDPETGYTGGTAAILRPGQEQAIQALPVISAELASAGNDIKNITQNIDPASGQDTTARFVKYLTSQQDKLGNYTVHTLSERLFKPVIGEFLDKMKCFLTDEKVIKTLTDKEVSEFFTDNPENLKQMKKQFEESGVLVEKQGQFFVNLGQGEPLPLKFAMKFNPLLNKLSMNLTKFVLSGFEATVKIIIDKNDYSKPFFLELLMQLASFAQTFQDQGLKAKAFLAIANRFMQLTDDPQAEKWLEIFNEDVQRLSQPDPMQGVKIQLEGQKVEADTAQKKASAANLSVQAQKGKQELDGTAQKAQLLDQLVGAAQQTEGVT